MNRISLIQLLHPTFDADELKEAEVLDQEVLQRHLVLLAGTGLLQCMPMR